jgi:cell division septation protein DedD
MAAPAQEIAKEPVVVEKPELAPVANNDRYFLIGGSFREENNANTFIEMMKKEGFDAEDLGVFNGLHRISIQRFSNFQEAKERLNELRAETSKSGVWIHIKQ